TSAIADTGTFFISLPTPMAESIWQAIGATAIGNGTDLATIDCNASTPVVFTFSSTPYAIPASAYIINSEGSCFTGFESGNDPTPENPHPPAIFGDVFLRVWYSHFDVEGHRVG
ncbi:pepsin A-like protein, partial [Blyttiomyces helicus]